MSTSDQSLCRDVLSFWFEQGVVPGFCEFRPVWFASNPVFDAEVAKRFRQAYDQAAAGRLDDMAETPRGCLALVILLDQVPRNLFRGTAQAFATDAAALALTCKAQDCGFDAALPPMQRMFLYLPFQHSEALADQRRSVALFETLGEEPVFRWMHEAAERHRDLIARFGRFPHRNLAMSRQSTAAEQTFLDGPEGRWWLS